MARTMILIYSLAVVGAVYLGCLIVIFTKALARRHRNKRPIKVGSG
jgi:hypothetical protein